MKKINFIVLNILFISVLSGCYYDVESELYPTTTISACDTVKPTYAGVIQPLIGSSCAISGCHVNGAQTPDLSSYSGLKAAIERVKARAITEKSMPPSGALGSCNLEYLQTWINAGALND
jgi:hypothetical protein